MSVEDLELKLRYDISISSNVVMAEVRYRAKRTMHIPERIYDDSEYSHNLQRPPVSILWKSQLAG